MNERGVITVSVGNMIKGVALLMMVFHHCYGIPAWSVDGIQQPSCLEAFRDTAISFNLCVSVYAFLTGWVYFHHADKSCRYSLSKVMSLMAEYGILVFFTAVAAAVFCGYEVSCSRVGKELFPFSANHKLMIFAWYIRFYVVSMLLLPYIALVFNMPGIWRRLLLVMVTAVGGFYSLVFLGRGEDVYWLPCIISGYVCAQYRILELIADKVKSRCAGLLLGLMMVWGAYWLYHNYSRVLLGPFHANAGAVYAPLFCCGWVFLAPLMKKLRLLMVLVYFGNHSLNVWLLHGIFFSVVTKMYFQPFAYWLDSPFYVLSFVMGSCLVVSIVLKPLQRLVVKYCVRVLFVSEK